jgi:hypothetical protein
MVGETGKLLRTPGRDVIVDDALSEADERPELARPILSDVASHGARVVGRASGCRSLDQSHENGLGARQGIFPQLKGDFSGADEDLPRHAEI